MYLFHVGTLLMQEQILEKFAENKDINEPKCNVQEKIEQF